MTVTYYWHGGVKADISKAVKYFEKAALAYEPGAIAWLGYHYRYCNKDGKYESSAKKLFQSAEGTGHPLAIKELRKRK